MLKTCVNIDDGDGEFVKRELALVNKDEHRFRAGYSGFRAMQGLEDSRGSLVWERHALPAEW